MLSLLGSVLTEISLVRLLVALFTLLIVPGLLLGAAAIAAVSWASRVWWKIGYAVAGVWSLVLLLLLAALGWFGWRPLLRAAETSFWSLNALVVQPLYAGLRELVRHLAEQFLPADAPQSRRAALRAVAAATSGVLVCALALFVLGAAWPATQFHGGLPPLASAKALAGILLANTAVLVSAYLAAAALVWGVADALMSQPRDADALPEPAPGPETWRVVHLSDIHLVAERYGFRIESGRAGPQGNDRWRRVLDHLDAIHTHAPLDLVLVTGDVTDAGRAAEWAEFLDSLTAYPALAERFLILPGNHDVNIVDRSNPARLDLPTSPNRRLRQARALSAMDAVQGNRVHVPGEGAWPGPTLRDAVAPHRAHLARTLDTGRPLLDRCLPALWDGVFPMVLPPAAPGGLGVVLLDSNAVTHFSFTNALGLVSAEQARVLDRVLRADPEARWIVALHHHLVEYPHPAKALSERIGTALINGDWLVRRLLRTSDRVVVMHGHRHIDWIGECAGLRIVSAPSPVMEATNDVPTCFYIHTLAASPGGGVRLTRPEKVTILPGPA